MRSKTKSLRIFLTAVGTLLAAALLLWMIYPNSSAKKSSGKPAPKIENPDNLLLQSARKGDALAAAYYLSKGSNINCRDSAKRTPLILAAAAGHNDTVVLLLQSGAKINSLDVLNNCALAMAAGGGYINTIRSLLRYGADVNCAWEHDRSALQMAAENGHTEIVALLIKSGADVNKTAINGESALVKALQHNHIATALQLLESGASVKAADKNGNTVLMLSINTGSVELIGKILGTRQNIFYHTNHAGENVFDIAEKLNNQQIIKLLKEYKQVFAEEK